MDNSSLTRRFGYIFVLVVLALSCFPALLDAQCSDTYFKTGYRKILPGYRDLQAYDWTGDGKPDFWHFAVDPISSNESIIVYANNGSGDFAWNDPVTYTTTIPSSSFGIYSYSLVDFNNDGRTDIFVYGGTFSQVHINRGDGSFSALTPFTATDEVGFGQLATIGLIDINGDSTLDWVKLLSIPNVGRSISYRIGKPDGTFGPRIELAAGAGIPVEFQVIGDFNGDGKKDIAYRFDNGDGSFPIRVFFNNGNGTFSPGPAFFAPISAAPKVADMNKDGKDDLVSIEMTGQPAHTTRTLRTLQSNGDGTFTVHVHLTLQTYERPAWYADPNAAEFKIGDFNGDGYLDIIEFGGTFHSVHLSNGSELLSRRDYFDQLGPADQLILADFNGDHRTDIYQKGWISGGMINTFNEQLVIIKYPQCQPVGETKAANFDGSLANDVAMWNPITGDWTSTEANWLNPEQLVKTYNWGLGFLGDEPVIGDWDGDGRSDYAVYRHTNGVWYIHQSASSFDLSFQFGLTGDRPVPADYDGDGLTDIAVFRPSSGDWFVWLTGPQQLVAMHWGLEGDRPVPQDYDGDGKTDVAVFRPSEGNWYIFRSSDQNFEGIHWGLGTDTVVPADYDGDGKADIAVWRSGAWYILRSSNGAFSSFYWGMEGDIPIPTYINRESAVPVVYRPSNSIWYDYQEHSTGRVFSTSPSAPVWVGRSFY